MLVCLVDTVMVIIDNSTLATIMILDTIVHN